MAEAALKSNGRQAELTAMNSVDFWAQRGASTMVT
jgi:hypothetical protein